MTKQETTAKVQRLRISYTDGEVAKLIGLSKPTLYSRLKSNKWKVSEIFLIEKLKK